MKRHDERPMPRLRCPHCQSVRSTVLGKARSLKTDTSLDFTRRWRKCYDCKRNFHTREFVEGSTTIDMESIRLALAFIGRAAARLQSITPTRTPKTPAKSKDN